MKRLFILSSILLLNGCLIWYTNVLEPPLASKDKEERAKPTTLHYGISATAYDGTNFEPLYKGVVQNAIVKSRVAESYQNDNDVHQHFNAEKNPGPFLQIIVSERRAEGLEGGLYITSQIISGVSLMVIPGYQQDYIDIEMSLFVPGQQSDKPEKVSHQLHRVHRNTLFWIAPFWIANAFTKSKPDVFDSTFQVFLEKNGEKIGSR
jgi:hypothetical protein